MDTLESIQEPTTEELMEAAEAMEEIYLDIVDAEDGSYDYGIRITTPFGRRVL